METMARLRSKHGSTIEDNVIIPDNYKIKNQTGGGWYFISRFKNLPDDIVSRYSMIFIEPINKGGNQ